MASLFCSKSILRVLYSSKRQEIISPRSLVLVRGFASDNTRDNKGPAKRM